MSELLTAKAFFERHQAALDLAWVAGQSGADRNVDPKPFAQKITSLVGLLHSIHPPHIQVIGREEYSYLLRLAENSRAELLESLFQQAPLAVVVADRQSIPDDLRQCAESSATPLFSSSVSGRKVVNYLQEYYDSKQAPSCVIHGVFMDVRGLGVLLMGKSGIGKSELALELLSRGHRLIADDAPEFTRTRPDTLNGHCPSLLRDFIEVRGLGVLNVRSLFGDSAIRSEKNLRLIIQLKEMGDQELLRMDRLEGCRSTRVYLDVEIPEITLPVAPGRNLAVLVEGAVSNHILRLKGYQAAQEFIKRQRQQLAKGQS